MKELCDVTLVENRRLATSLWQARFIAEGKENLLRRIKAGMFAMIRCDEADQLRFRRPFSFAGTSPEKSEFTLYYQVVGSQTQSLSSLGEGEVLSAVLPLGNSFTMPPGEGNVLCIAGGVGVAPLLMLTRQIGELGGELPKFLFGARSKDEICQEYLEQFPARFSFATDDGSFGYKGTVTDLLRKEGYAKDDYIYACGPKPMLGALASILESHFFAEVSLEEMMACGIGACYGCAARTIGKGADEMKLVCCYGPVFKLSEVVF